MKTTKNLSLYIILGFSALLSFSFSNGGGDKKILKSEIHYLEGAPTPNVLNELPRKTKTIEFNNKELYFYNEIYYQKLDDKYQQTIPPIGLSVKNVPDNYERIIKNGQIIYFVNGSFYSKNPTGKYFVVSTGIVGVQITNLPEQSVKAKLNGRDCYIYFNTVFKKTSSRSRDLYSFVGYIAD